MVSGEHLTNLVLMSKEALEGLAQYREVNLFLRGIVPEIGYKTAVVYYDRGERFAGESKYPLKKMISFAIEGISSFSVKPLKMISTIGILISLLSGFGLLYALISKICGVAVPGWTAIVCSIWLLGGVQLCVDAALFQQQRSSAKTAGQLEVTDGIAGCGHALFPQNVQRFLRVFQFRIPLGIRAKGHSLQWDSSFVSAPWERSTRSCRSNVPLSPP